MRRVRRRSEASSDELELEQARPYLELAREIQAEVARIAADPSAHSDLLVELIDGLPRGERLKLAQTIFGELPPERQWAVIEAAYGDEEIRTYLDAQHSSYLDQARAAEQRLDLARRVLDEHRLDTRLVPIGEQVTLGLFREQEVRAALDRGHTSSSCARRVVLQAMGEGTFRLLDDVFNPNGGFFVTAEYSEDTWRTEDRLPAHSIVRIGSLTSANAQDGEALEPVVYAGGRIDFEVQGQSIRGRLHLGFAMLGDVDVFARQ